MVLYNVVIFKLHALFSLFQKECISVSIFQVLIFHR